MSLSPADLRLWQAAAETSQRPYAVVHIGGGLPVRNVVSADFDTGVDQQSSTASVRIAADAYPTFTPKQSMEISYGYVGALGGLKYCFRGEVEDIDTRYLPYFIEIKGAGYLKRLQHNAGNPDTVTEAQQPVKTWNSVTDTQIWNDVMALGPVPAYSAGDGDGRTITGPIVLNQTDSLRNFIDQLDAASESGQRTFEFNGVVYRKPMLRVPSSNPTYRYADRDIGYPVMQLYSVSRGQSDRDVVNQVYINGTPAAGVDITSTDYVYAVEQAFSPYWGYDGNNNPIYNQFNMSSVFLETRDQCAAVARRYMIERNKVTDKVTLRTPLNPFAFPTATLGLLSDRMGLTVQTNYWVTHVHHHWGTDGAYTDWQLEGGAGDEGYLVGLAPNAQFTVKVTKETWLVSGTPTTYYTVTADGSGSYDPDNTALSYAWSNNKNGDTGSAVTYVTKFTAAQWNDATTPPAIELIVTDSDSPTPHTGDTGMLPVTSMMEGDTLNGIAMFVAAYGQADATPDGWETRNTWTPGGGAHVISVCRIGAEGTNYFGLDNGTIYKTTDYLQTTPTAVSWTAPGGSAVNALWLSETNSNVVGIGLANGDFYITRDAFATAPTKMYSFINPITWVEGSYENIHQWRVGVGQDVWYTNNDFQAGDVRVLVAFSGLTVEQTELTPFANYASAHGAAGSQVLKRESDGYPFTFPALSPAPSKIRMTAFILTDDLLIGDDQGRSFISSPASDATTPTQMTSIGYGEVNDMLRDNTNPASAYAACHTALAKTFDKAVSWVEVIAYNGTTTKALQLGYDSAPLSPPVVITAPEFLVERGSALFGVVSPATDNVAGVMTDNGLTLGMDLYNESSHTSDPVPTDWYKKAFDDTVAYGSHEWKTISSAQVFGTFKPLDTVYGSWSVAPNGTSMEPTGNTTIFRHKFVLPSFTLATVTFQWFGRSGETILALYVNDTAVSIGSDADRYLDPSLFVADGVTENVVAIETSSASNYPGFAWLMVFSSANNTFYLSNGTMDSVVSTSDKMMVSSGAAWPTNWTADVQVGETDGHTNNTAMGTDAILRPQGTNFYTPGLFRKDSLNLKRHVAEGVSNSAWAGTDAALFLRRIFTAPGTVANATLSMRVIGQVTEIYLNGHALAGTPYAFNGNNVPWVYHLTPTEVGYIHTSALNAISFKVTKYGSLAPSLSFVLDFANFTGTTL